MRITCPHCGFFKEIDAGQIPARVVRVTCPECRQPFALPRDEEPAPPPAAAAPPDAGIETEAFAASESTPEPGVEATALESAADPAAAAFAAPDAVDSPADDASGAPIDDEPGEPLEAAGIGARYAALLIDAMLILIMVLSMRAGLNLLGNGIAFEGQLLLSLTFTLFALVLGFTYHTLFIGICGQTPGKRLMRIQVVMIDRSAMTYPRAMLREILGKTLSTPLLLGYAMALFHPQHLAAHDKIADTRVVKFTP